MGQEGLLIVSVPQTHVLKTPFERMVLGGRTLGKCLIMTYTWGMSLLLLQLAMTASTYTMPRIPAYST